MNRILQVLVFLALALPAHDASIIVTGPPASIFSSGSPPIVISQVSINETSTAQASHTIGSATYNANTLYMIVAVVGDTTTDPDVTSISGTANLTWTQIGERHFNTAGTPLSALSAWYTMTNAATTGTVVVNFTTTHEATHIYLMQATGADTSGANGAGALVQSNITAAIDASTAIQTNTLPSAFGASGNAAVAAFAGDHGTSYTATFESTWVELVDDGINAPNNALTVGYVLLAGDTSVTVTNTTSKDWAGIMWEIKKQ